MSARTFSLGISPASDSLLAFTIIMNRMSAAPFIDNEQVICPFVNTSNGSPPDRQAADRSIALQ
jgi:hypothetical protein